MDGFVSTGRTSTGEAVPGREISVVMKNRVERSYI